MRSFLLFIGAASIFVFSSCSKHRTKEMLPQAGVLQNSGFEAGAANPAGWTSSSKTGDGDAAYVSAGGYRGAYALEQQKAAAYEVKTFQQLSGLDDGNYKLTAFIKNSGGQHACYLYGAGADSIVHMTSLPVSAQQWSRTTVRGIKVSDGNCIVGLYSDAKANDWCKLDDVTLTRDDSTYLFLKGGDVSELSYIESKGGKFYEDGVQKDCFQILKDKGFNAVRLRLYNDPGNPAFSPSKELPAGFQDPADILSLARRAKAAGMNIVLTFHCSDYWTGPAAQTKPHAWDSLDFAGLKKAVYDFTLKFLEEMKQQGTTPGYVALGNETSDGFLFPDGQSSHFAQMVALFNEGYDAVKAASPSSQVIIHLDDAGDTDKYDWFFNTFLQDGGKFDIIGASYYPFWTNKTVAQIVTWAETEGTRFGRKILLMETGYNWNPSLPDGAAGQLAGSGPYGDIYPESPEGQLDFLYELFSGIKNSTALIGDLYWDPVMTAVPGVGWELGAPNVVANSTLFDFDGNALPSLNAYKYNN